MKIASVKLRKFQTHLPYTKFKNYIKKMLQIHSNRQQISNDFFLIFQQMQINMKKVQKLSDDNSNTNDIRSLNFLKEIPNFDNLIFFLKLFLH